MAPFNAICKGFGDRDFRYLKGNEDVGVLGIPNLQIAALEELASEAESKHADAPLEKVESQGMFDPKRTQFPAKFEQVDMVTEDHGPHIKPGCQRP